MFSLWFWLFGFGKVSQSIKFFLHYLQIQQLKNKQISDSLMFFFVECSIHRNYILPAVMLNKNNSQYGTIGGMRSFKTMDAWMDQRLAKTVPSPTTIKAKNSQQLAKNRGVLAKINTPTAGVVVNGIQRIRPTCSIRPLRRIYQEIYFIRI